MHLFSCIKLELMDCSLMYITQLDSTVNMQKIRMESLYKLVKKAHFVLIYHIVK